MLRESILRMHGFPLSIRTRKNVMYEAHPCRAGAQLLASELKNQSLCERCGQEARGSPTCVTEAPPVDVAS